MGKLILRISVSIDGFIESSEVKVDFNKSRSPEGAAWLTTKIGNASAHLMGRKAFAQLSSFWPTAPGPIAQKMNEIPKIVFSRKGFVPSSATQAAGWVDAKVLAGDLASELAELKKTESGDLIAHGGVEFAQNVVGTGLVDEFWLATHPIAMGKGSHLFEKLSQPLYLKLIETKVFATGAIINVYRPE